MTSIKACIYDVDYYINEEQKPVIRLFGRTTSGEKICAFDPHFEPYFLVEAEGDLPAIRKELEKLSEDNFEVTRTEIVKRIYKEQEREFIKVYVNVPAAVPALRDNLKHIEGVIERYEADIMYGRRYLLDKQITPLEAVTITGKLVESHVYNVDTCIEVESISAESESFDTPKILAFDIEVYTNHGRFPNSRSDPILMISIYGKDYQKVICWKRFETEDDTYLFVDSEAELIKTFVDIINEQQPDYLAGYYTDGFDFPYIRDRAKKHDINLVLGADNSVIRFAKAGIKETKIVGIPHLDLVKFIKTVLRENLKTDSYSLDNVAFELLGEKKHEMEHGKMGEMWDAGGDAVKYLCEYNLQDSKLTYDLAEKILPTISELSRITMVPIHDSIRLATGQIAESYLIKKAAEEHYLIPNKPAYTESTMRRMHTYQGAYVFDTTPGIYENIVVFDFKSLYPSIIIAHNIDPGSLTDIPDEQYKTPDLVEDDQTVHFYFKTKPHAFIPRTLKDLLARRNNIKEMLKQSHNPDRILQARSAAFKIVTNSVYGLYGFFGARWYCREGAAAITAWGRHYIQQAANEAEQEGFTVLAGDTDSLMLRLNDKTREDALTFMNKVNEKLPEAMELDLEDFYVRGIFVSKKNEAVGAKKKYAFVNDAKKLKIKGFETVRRDWSMLARNTQREVLRILLDENQPKKALDYVKKVVQDLRSKKIEIKELTIRTQIRKDISSYENVGPHVKVAERMKELGMPVGVGTTIEYIITEGKGILRNRAKLPEECGDEEYDSEYYINNQIIPAVEMIFDTVGFTKEDLIADKKQMSLGDFS